MGAWEWLGSDAFYEARANHASVSRTRGSLPRYSGEKFYFAEGTTYSFMYQSSLSLWSLR